MSIKVNEDESVLKGITYGQASKSSIEDIQAERSGEQLGLYSSYGNYNRAMLKYSRFNHTTLIAAPTGSAKSYFLNALEDDFTNPDINGWFAENTLVLAFKFEMSGSDEIIRNIGRRFEKSFSYLLSSESTSRESNTYNRLSDVEFEAIRQQLQRMSSKPIIFFESSGNAVQIYNTVRAYAKKNPKKKLVVSLDHSLLTKRFDERSDGEVISSVAQLSVALRAEFEAHVIIVNQFNNNIKSPERKRLAALHHPDDSDVYIGSQLIWACDNVFLMLMPEKLGLEYYSTDKLNPMGLIHVKCSKSRRGKTGDLWFKNELHKGKISELSYDQVVRGEAAI